jgi:hypothetical protein
MYPEPHRVFRYTHHGLRHVHGRFPLVSVHHLAPGHAGKRNLGTSRESFYPMRHDGSDTEHEIGSQQKPAGGDRSTVTGIAEVVQTRLIQIMVLVHRILSGERTELLPDLLRVHRPMGAGGLQEFEMVVRDSGSMQLIEEMGQDSSDRGHPGAVIDQDQDPIARLHCIAQPRRAERALEPLPQHGILIGLERLRAEHPHQVGVGNLDRRNALVAWIGKIDLHFSTSLTT